MNYNSEEIADSTNRAHLVNELQQLENSHHQYNATPPFSPDIQSTEEKFFHPYNFLSPTSDASIQMSGFHRHHRRHNSLLRLPSFKKSFVNLVSSSGIVTPGLVDVGKLPRDLESAKKGKSGLHDSNSTTALLSAAASSLTSSPSDDVAGGSSHSNNSSSSKPTRVPMSSLQRCACIHIPKLAFFFLIGGVILLYLLLAPTFTCSGHTRHMQGNEQTLAFYTDDDSKLWFPPWDYITNKYITPEELDFPLAYSIIAYTDAKQVFMLLRAIYRKHNHYCIHLDANSAPDMRLLLHQTLADLPNLVFVNSPVHVIHSTFTVLEADLLCMRELLKSHKKWFYFINLTGQEYPRKTNLELVRILKTMNGSNLLHKDTLLWDRVMKRIWSDPPYNIKLWKGSVHIIVVREFVEFALYDKRSVALLEYLKNTNIPDESFFSTLNHNLHLRAPGGYKGNESTSEAYPFINRLKIWWNEWHDIPCYGVYVRLICIFGENNYPDLINEDNPTLFMNKFIVPINGRLFRRIDDWFHERQKRIYAHPEAINMTFYETRMPQRFNHF